MVRCMKLYSQPLSPYSARVRAAIYAKNLPVEIVAPPEDWRSSNAFRTVNPLMRIPVLVLDNGATLPESGVIVEYLEDKFPKPSLRPRTPEALARVRLVTQVADLYVMPAAMPLFYLYDQPQRDEVATQAQWTKLKGMLAQLERLLVADTFATGDRMTTADVWLAPLRFTLFGLMDFTSHAGLLKDFPAIDAYAEVAHKDAVLGRVWREMMDGYEVFMNSRAAKMA
jgi:glutathione S-transferase